MEKHEWLWKSKFSETIDPETESSSSISSHPEKFSDDQKVLVPLKQEAFKESCSTEKLSLAITGWERAKKEVKALKKKLDVSMKKNSSLEDQVSHLDEALMDCVRQLRQARDEQEQNMQNSALKLELELRTTERDLCNKAAEAASKQNLESVKKVAQLESECRRLKAEASKSSVNHETTSTESLTDTQSNVKYCSNSWASALISELDQLKNEKVSNRSLHAQASSSTEITLMDDFLEMERLAALPDSMIEERCLESKTISNVEKDETKVNEEDLAVAAGKLAECQEMIASIGKQLESLATSEDLLIDTGSIPQFPGEAWKFHSNEMFLPRGHFSNPGSVDGNAEYSANEFEGNLPISFSSSSTLSWNHVSNEKKRNGFAKFFTQS